MAYSVTRTKELEQQITQTKEKIKKLEDERANLIAKIEAGEGVATAINQLKEENVRLSMVVAAYGFLIISRIIHLD